MAFEFTGVMIGAVKIEIYLCLQIENREEFGAVVVWQWGNVISGTVIG